VAPEALREDAGRLDRRRVVEVGDRRDGTDREAPCPTLARRIVLWVPDDVGDGEDRLPDGRVEDRAVAALNRRAFRRRVRADLVSLDVRVQRPLAPAADEQPLRQRRSTTPAMAIPKPMHMLAIP
jgi:hypothetical protein